MAAEQMKANVRVLLRPLVETMPCIGAVTITLLELPYVDASLHIGNRLDIMQLPGIKQAVNFAISKAPPPLASPPADIF